MLGMKERACRASSDVKFHEILLARKFHKFFTETFIENFTVNHRLKHRYGALIGVI